MLARWRDAAKRASEAGAIVVPPVVVERAAEVEFAPAPLAEPLSPAAPPDEVTALAQLDEELTRAVAAPAAEAIGRLLALPRAALLSERTAESRAELLAALDLVEDVLDAVLLTGARDAHGQEPP
jgi:hypothetical protein